jgi:hypothetical protein
MRYLLSGVGVLLSMSLAGSPRALSAEGGSTLYVVSYLKAAAASQGQVAMMLQFAGARPDHAASRRALRSTAVQIV